MRTFNIVLLCIFGLFIVGGVIVPLLLVQRMILGYAFVLDALGWQ